MEIVLPKKIRLAGQDVKIEIDDETLWEEGNLGCFYGIANKIKYHSDSRSDIILHEIIEAILAYYRGTDKIDHTAIVLLSACLADVFDQLNIQLKVPK